MSTDHAKINGSAAAYFAQATAALAEITERMDRCDFEMRTGNEKLWAAITFGMRKPLRDLKQALDMVEHCLSQ